MKNLHYLKKFVVMVLAAMMTLSTFALPTFAAETDAKISGVESGAKVMAYQFVTQDTNNDWVMTKAMLDTGKVVLKPNTDDPAYKNNGYTYIVTDPDDASVKAEIDITAESYNKAALAIISKLVPKTGAGVVELEEDGTTGNYSAALPKYGSYVVLVTDTTARIYSPMVISKDTKDKEGQFKVTEAKVQEPTPKKEITDTNSTPKVNVKVANDWDKTAHGDTLAVGEIDQFTITAPVPSYSGEYFYKDNTGKEVYPEFNVSDTMTHISMVVDATHPFEVKHGTKTLVKDTDYSLVSGKTETGSKAFKIKLINKELLRANPAANLEVKYWAKLDDDAVPGLANANTNEVEVEYQREPKVGETNKKQDITYHHTFEIDGKILGEQTGREFLKVAYPDGTWVVAEQELDKEIEYITGAKFQLQKKVGDNWVNVGDEVTTQNGLMNWKGLDCGTYQAIETFAPNPYKVNDRPVPIEISATLDGKGKITGYTVNVAGIVNIYTLDANGNLIKNDDVKQTFTINGEPTEVDLEGKDNSADFINNTVGTLPSTGGMGTVLFTIGGVAIMGLALLLLFGGKKKQHQK